MAQDTILKEDGDAILKEDGDTILLEQQAGSGMSYQQRGALINLSFPGRPWLTLPDGILDSADRLSLMTYATIPIPFSKQQRGSLLNLTMPNRPWLAEPDGTLDSRDRMSLMSYASLQLPASPITSEGGLLYWLLQEQN